MTLSKTASPPDECFRCGYDLRGVSNDRPCPECGLAAKRSRRVTDELHETRPRWLHSITAGACLTLTSIVVAAVWPFFADHVISALAPSLVDWRWYEALVFSGFGVAAIIFLAGTLLLAKSEGYQPADHADRGLRRWLRLAALVPFFAYALVCIAFRWQFESPWLTQGAPAACMIAAAPLPLLLFLRLRRLGQARRSAHLAEHCVIVGIGATGAVVCLAAMFEIMMNGEELARRLGWRPNWDTNSTASLIFAIICALTICLFSLWSFYLLLRFTIAFALAARQASRKWRRDDHSLGSRVAGNAEC